MAKQESTACTERSGLLIMAAAAGALWGSGWEGRIGRMNTGDVFICII